ncbi:MAG: ATP-grasp domain-containing protein [Melioribacteraceae bacterium]|nr:ATP-grasp domain-containing protein [Melioribacteraceae bacterium]MCF8266068.1 ATP-grasp domain-containing protein [Melioribacteraceae bacterium]
MKENKKILICYNEPDCLYENYTGKETNGSNSIDLSETSFGDDLLIIKDLLLKRFENVKLLPFTSNIVETGRSIQNFSPDAIINFVESIGGDANYESAAAGLLEILQYGFSGNTSICLGNSLHKKRAKQILKSFNINTPNYKYLTKSNNKEISNIQLDFPLIVKPAREDASIGISENSVVFDLNSLSKQINYIFKEFNQDVLVEEYIEGREFNAAILGNKVLPISEIMFQGLSKNLPNIVTYEGKWDPESEYYKSTIPSCPAQISDSLKETIERIAVDAFHALGCRDYVRIDIRVNQDNIPFVIEVNPNPDISIDSGFARSCKAAGISYEELINQLTNFALDRNEYYQKLHDK